MKENIQTLYRRLTEAYNAEALKRISAEIITAYKHKNSRLLQYYGTRLGLPPHPLSKLFMGLIIHFHPDKLALISKNLSIWHTKGQREFLEKYARAIGLDGYVTSAPKPPDESPEIFEEYGYNHSDFDSGPDYERGHNRRYDWDYEGEDFEDEEDYERYAAELDPDEEEGGIIEELKQYMYGNLDVEILPKDFLYLEGELVLAERHIRDLTGIEYCLNITSLDLSHNDLENIYPLGQLENLCHLDLAYNEITDIDALAPLRGLNTLDLSFNAIEEIEVLLNLEELEYVNLIGNPIRGSVELMRQLEEKGVMVML